MKPKIAIIGKGNVGGAIQRGLERAKYEVKSVGNDPQGVHDAAAWGDVIILAVPYRVLDDALHAIGGAASGKTLLDATNALTSDGQLALGFTTSGAEELQRKAPTAKVVKAFNTVFAGHMSTGKIKTTSLTLFVAADDKEAKNKVLSLGRDIGFDAVDAGPLKNARWLEAIGYFSIQLGYVLGMGTQIGMKLVR